MFSNLRQERGGADGRRDARHGGNKKESRDHHHAREVGRRVQELADEAIRAESGAYCHR